MDRITEDLYIGDSEDYEAPDLSRLDTIINLSTVNLDTMEQLERPVIDIPIRDGNNELLNFFLAVDTVKKEIQREGTAVMVCCREGVSRSPAVTAAALASLNGTDLQEELDRIKEVRPQVNPLPPLIKLSRYYLGEPG